MTVIEVRGLSKKYHLGATVSHDTLRDAIAHGFASIFRRNAGSERHSEDETIWALKDVSFDVQEGEVLGIIGRNGAGKSTLLKILSRITEPTSGEAKIRGRVGSLLEVGTGFHPELTGRENVFLNGAILGMRKEEIKRKFDEIVAFAEVEKFLETPVKRYSSGMYVRLAFAVAAHFEPEILMVDEVLAVGDVQFQKKCLNKMSDESKSGRTILYVSHNLASINNFCSRAILLESGEIVKEGEPSDVLSEYIKSMGSQSGRIVWESEDAAPGSDDVRLHSVRVYQEGRDQLSGDVDIAKDIVVEIMYWNRKEGEPYYTAIHLRDKLGTYVLSSGNAKGVSLTDDTWTGRPHPVGLYRSVCRIPGNFLNEGLYFVTAIVGRGISDTIIMEDAILSFNVIDTGEMRKYYYGGWLGTVRPQLAWETEKID